MTEMIPDPDTPRNYKSALRSFDCLNHEEIAFEKAKREVLALQLTIKQAALKYNVPESALEDNTQLQFLRTKPKESAHARKRRMASIRWKQLLRRKEFEEKKALAAERGEEMPTSLLDGKKNRKESLRRRLKRLMGQRKRNRENRIAKLRHTKERWTEALLRAREVAAVRDDESSRAEVKATEQRLTRLERELRLELEKERIADELLAVPPPQTSFGRVIVHSSSYGTVDNRERRARLNRLRAVHPSMITKGIW